MPEDNFQEGQQAFQQVNTSSTHILLKIFILISLILGFITTFVSGYFLSNLMASEKGAAILRNNAGINQQVKKDNQSRDNIPGEVQDSTKFLPGKHYFDDTIIIVSKNKPQINLVATVTRTEQENGYIQNTRSSFYDGSSWVRKSKSQLTNDSAILGNDLVKSWNINIDASRVLKETMQGAFSINNYAISFSTETLQNEIGIRSLPGYTKFMSNGKGTITVNGAVHDAYVIYTHIYSLNAADIQFYSQPFGLTTDWIAFWDTQGNFYHVDTTSVDKPTPIYQTHQLGIFEDAVNGLVAKTFKVSVNRDSKNPPEEYSVSLNFPIDANLKFKRINAINKSPNNSYIWYMGNIEGTVSKQNGEVLNGIGLVEYIHD